MIQHLLTALFTRIFVNQTKKSAEKQNQNEKDEVYGKVYLPRVYSIIGWICTIFFTVLAIIVIFTSSKAGFMFLAFDLLGILLILSGRNSKIEYDSFGFSAANFLGKKREFKYIDVVDTVLDPNGYYVITTKGKVQVDHNAIGSEQFMDKIQENMPEKSLKTSGKVETKNLIKIMMGICFIFFLGLSVIPMLVDNQIKIGIYFSPFVLIMGVIWIGLMIDKVQYNEEEICFRGIFKRNIVKVTDIVSIDLKSGSNQAGDLMYIITDINDKKYKVPFFDKGAEDFVNFIMVTNNMMPEDSTQQQEYNN